MQVTVETTSGLERKMHVVVPGERVDAQVDEKIKQTAKQANIKGFRPGKVPVREVKRRFGDGIRQEVSSEVIQSTYGEALQQEDINPAGMPSIEEVKIEEGQDLEYTAVFEVFPEVKVAGFEDISVERLVSEVTDTDLEEMIETLREQRITYNEVDRAAADNDQVKVDFEGFLDGEAFEGGKAEGADIVLGSGSMIPGFEEGIAGITAGEEKEIEVTFPEDYQAEHLAGQVAKFNIKAISVSEPVKPELNDEFFAQFDVKEGGMEAFREEVRSNMQRELDSAIKSKVKNQVMDGLYDTNEFDLPSSLIDQEVNRMRQEAVQRFGGENAQIDPSMLPAEMFSDQAEKRVKIGLIVNGIVEEKEVKPDDARVRETIESMASSYEDPDQVINFYYSNEQQLSQIQSMVLEDQIVDLVLETAKVTEKTVPYEEAVKQQAPEAEDAEASDSEDA
jgi:trigger factor